MSCILSIESAINGFSVAVHREGTLLSTIQLLNERVASSLLTSAIEQVLIFSELTVAEIEAVSVSSGPGSYTGLRVGIATAKGLCSARDLPLIAVNTLELMNASVNIPQITSSYFLCPMIDARRMEVYCGIYDGLTTENIKEVHAKVVDEDTFSELLSIKKIIFFGNGSPKIKPLYDQNPNAIFLPEVVSPKAEHMGNISYQKFLAEDFENLATFEPAYLKPYFATKPKNQLSPQ